MEGFMDGIPFIAGTMEWQRENGALLCDKEHSGLPGRRRREHGAGRTMI